jgi:hypothetical protein
MVDKNGGDFVSLPEEESFGLSFEARDRGFKLVDGYAFARFGNCFDLVGLCLGSPRLLGCSAIEARLALWDSASSESLWYLPFSCHEANVGEWKMSKAVMPA